MMGEWISVEDKLPKIGKVVIAAFGETEKSKLSYGYKDAPFPRVRGEMTYLGEEDGWHFVERNDNEDYCSAPLGERGVVTHWMPLPPPPET